MLKAILFFIFILLGASCVMGANYNATTWISIEIDNQTVRLYDEIGTEHEYSCGGYMTDAHLFPVEYTCPVEDYSDLNFSMTCPSLSCPSLTCPSYPYPNITMPNIPTCPSCPSYTCPSLPPIPNIPACPASQDTFNCPECPDVECQECESTKLPWILAIIFGALFSVVGILLYLKVHFENEPGPNPTNPGVDEEFEDFGK